METFYERIKQISESKGIKLTNLVKELKLSTSMPTNWKNGQLPAVDTLLLLSSYFGVSIDYLLKGEVMEKDQKILENLQLALGRDISQNQANNSKNNNQKNESNLINKKEKNSFNDNDNYSNEIYNRIELMCRFSGKTIENIIENTSIVEKDFENLKNGKAPSFLMLKALSNFFNCSINYLIFGELHHDNEYSNKINAIIKKYKISHEQFTSYSGVPYNILDLFGKGILPIGLLHWRVQNSIENLSGRHESFDFEVDYSKCNYFVCETCEAKNYIEMLKLPQEKQDKVWEFIKGLE